jgi:hypothetical protein
MSSYGPAALSYLSLGFARYHENGMSYGKKKFVVANGSTKCICIVESEKSEHRDH